MKTVSEMNGTPMQKMLKVLIDAFGEQDGRKLHARIVEWERETEEKQQCPLRREQK